MEINSSFSRPTHWTTSERRDQKKEEALEFVFEKSDFSIRKLPEISQMYLSACQMLTLFFLADSEIRFISICFSDQYFFRLYCILETETILRAYIQKNLCFLEVFSFDPEKNLWFRLKICALFFLSKNIIIKQ
jgi:hypothetical protein